MIEWFLNFTFGLISPLLPKSIRTGYLRIVMRQVDNSLTAFYVKLDDHFEIGEMRYEINTNEIMVQGKWKTPTLIYNFDNSNLLNLQSLGLENKMNPMENHNRMETHIAREVIESFDDNMLSGKMAGILILGAVFLVGGILYYQIDSNFAELAQQLLLGTTGSVSASQ